jgi:hypothetical protein
MTGEAIDLAIAKTLPTGEGQRDVMVLELVRQLRRFGIRSADACERHLRTWWEHAYPVVGTKQYWVTRQAFHRAWKQFDPKKDALLAAMTRAMRTDPPPEVVGVYDDKPKVVLLASVCRELQRHVGPGSSFLLARTAAALVIGERHPKQAGRYLQTLWHDGLIEQSHPGIRNVEVQKRLAARWVYRGAL